MRKEEFILKMNRNSETFKYETNIQQNSAKMLNRIHIFPN